VPRRLNTSNRADTLDTKVGVLIRIRDIEATIYSIAAMMCSSVMSTRQPPMVLKVFHLDQLIAIGTAAVCTADGAAAPARTMDEETGNAQE
jgi:hypothetical protein